MILFTRYSQAPDLYRRLGYGLVGSVDGYPRTGTAHWFGKHLESVE
ncbi:MAG: hypothetical protein ACRD0A_08740 [Acidimicrobiales bacterium]